MVHQKSRYRIARRAGYKGARPSVIQQAEIGKYATGLERSSQPPHHQKSKSTKEQNFIFRPNIESYNTTCSKKIRKFHQWKAGQINIQSCSDDFRLDQMLKQCKSANLDIVCIQEMRRIGDGSISHEGYNLYWNGMKTKRMYGVGIAIRKSLSILVNGIVNVSPRVMAADITVRGCKIRVVSAYAPTEDKPLSTKKTFYRELCQVGRVSKERKLFIQGDFNATSSLCCQHSSFDGNANKPYDDENDTANENGGLFLEFCRKEGMSILNTWFDHIPQHRITWHSPDGRTKKVYDFSLSGSWLRQFVTNVRVRNSYFNSDHRLLVTNLKTPANKAARWTQHRKVAPRCDLGALSNEKIKKTIQESIQESVIQSPIEGLELNCQHTSLVKSLVNAKEKLPKIKKIKQKHPWENNERFSQLIEDRNHIRKQSWSQENKENLKTVNKLIKKEIKSIKNEYYAKLGKEINEAKQHRLAVSMWRKAKGYDKVIKSKPKQISCPGLRAHFKNHFNPDQSHLNFPEEIQNPPQYIINLQVINTKIVNTSPSTKEIEDAVNSMKKGKASLDIEVELLKIAMNVSEFKHSLWSHFHNIWSRKSTPTQWSISRITSIWKKKGSALDASQYRGISVGPLFTKVAIKIILRRLTEFYESQLLPTQFGFRSGKGCNDGIFLMKQLQEIAVRSQRKLFTCYVDLSAAFDQVNRKFLFQSIKNRSPINQSNTNMDILESLYNSTCAYIANEDPIKDQFITTSGVRQGGSESPNLFNLYIDYVLRVYKNKCDHNGIGKLEIPFLIPIEATNRKQRGKAPSNGTYNHSEGGYADDIGIHSWSEKELQKMMDIFHEVFSEYGLTINTGKTESMIWNWNESIDGPYPEQIIKINDIWIQNSKIFKYLGVWNTFNDMHIGRREIDHRINSARSAFAEHRKMLTNKSIALSTRIIFLNGLVRSRLMYGCHAWRPTQSEIDKIQTTYHYFLRGMINNGFKRKNPPKKIKAKQQTDSTTVEEEDEEVEWGFIVTNEQLFNIAKTPSIKEFYIQQQRKWVAHIIRRENDNPCKALMFHSTKNSKIGRKLKSILELAIVKSGISRSQFMRECSRETH